MQVTVNIGIHSGMPDIVKHSISLTLGLTEVSTQGKSSSLFLPLLPLKSKLFFNFILENASAVLIKS